MNVEHIIREALMEYDATQTVIRYLLKNTSVTSTKTTNDVQRSKFEFIDKATGEIILDTDVEILGVFYDKLNIWSWAWSQIGLYNSENYLAKEMLLHAIKLGSDLSYIKSILTTSRGVIKDLTQIDINLAISSSIIKHPYVYPYVYKLNNFHLVYYFALINKPALEKLKRTIGKEELLSDSNFD